MSKLPLIPLDWKTIKSVFLDMDGTLLDLHFDNHFWQDYIPQKYAEKKHISLQQAEMVLATMYEEKAGTLDWYSLDYWEQALELDIVVLKHTMTHKIAVRTQVDTFLNFLQEQPVRTILLTNAHPKTVNIKFDHVSIEPYFDRIITSHDIGLAKETKGFWDKLRDTEHFDPAHSLFIDDNLKVLAEAKAHGIKHLFAIHQPDSQKAPEKTAPYTAIQCFTQIMG